MNGSRRWPVTAWRRLLERALRVLEGAEHHAAWSLGGGTALALRLHHRVSYDVDLFFEDFAALRALSPNRNPVAREVADRWQEPGNYIKLECAEGAIDFIVAGRQTELMPWDYPFSGEMITVEQPAEIVAKKLKYRGSRLLPRDIFDILALEQHDPRQLALAVRAVPDGARRAADRIERMAERYVATIREEVNPTTGGVALLEADPRVATAALRAG